VRADGLRASVSGNTWVRLQYEVVTRSPGSAMMHEMGVDDVQLKMALNLRGA
jgi:hypothetical protein